MQQSKGVGHGGYPALTMTISLLVDIIVISQFSRSMGRSQKKMLPSRHTLLILYQICNGVQDMFPSYFLARHRSLIFFAFDPGVKPLDVHVAYQGTKVLSLENNSKCEDDYLIHYVLQKMCMCVCQYFLSANLPKIQ